MIERDNYHLVKDFLAYQSEVLLKDPETLKHFTRFLKHLLRWADDVPFESVSEIRPVFPLSLVSLHRPSLSPQSVRRACLYARMFFHWVLHTDPARLKPLSAAWVETLQPPRQAVPPAKAREAVTLEMVRTLLSLPHEPTDLATWRDQAAAFLFLSGIRASAFCTLPISCADIERRRVSQDPTLGVHTKNKKSAVTYLYAIPDLLQVCQAWDDFIRARLPDTSPWYSVLDIHCGNQVLTSATAGRRRKNALADNIQKLFKRAGLKPLSPHKFRHGFAEYGLKQAKDFADLKAVSMNLMHGSLGITDSIYAVLSKDDLADKITRLASERGELEPRASENVEMAQLLKQILARLERPA